MKPMAQTSALIILAVLTAVATISIAQEPDTLQTQPVFSISSLSFSNGGAIPKQHTCSGENFSPPLQWRNPPNGAKSFALIADDPDAPMGVFVHWVIYNLPADTCGLSEKASPQGALLEGCVEGVNDFKRIGYSGPCPPPGKPHRYFFKLYALDTVVDIPGKATKALLIQKMQGHILDQAELVGLFGR